jgi:prepilin-type N-terminal cleavage/methylation domain-containing protein
MVVKTAIPLFLRRARGFTLMELIVVIAIVAILSVSATALLNTRSFDTARFTRELETVLAYAQKTAVAKRRTVSVTVTAGSAALTVCPAFDPCGAPVGLALPTQDGAATLAAPAGVTLSPAAFSFSPSGAASAPVTITVTGDAAYSVFVEGTGYVHR